MVVLCYKVHKKVTQNIIILSLAIFYMQAETPRVYDCDTYKKTIVFEYRLNFKYGASTTDLGSKWFL